MLAEPAKGKAVHEHIFFFLWLTGSMCLVVIFWESEFLKGGKGRKTVPALFRIGDVNRFTFSLPSAVIPSLFLFRDPPLLLLLL